MERTKVKRKMRLLPLFAAIACLGAATYMESTGERLGGLFIPLQFGLIKDILDPLLLVLLPWNGWVFLIPFGLAALVGWPVRWLLTLWVTMVVSMGVADTLVSFDVVSVSRLIKGVVHYFLMFGVVAFVACCVYWCLAKAFTKIKVERE